jgi:multidrug efflux system membrane fusion protein
VAVRLVTLGAAQEDNVAIKDGLSVGQVVVVEGADKLKEGSKVALKGQKSHAGQSSPGDGS